MIQSSQFQISSDSQPDGARLRLTGELDLATAPALEQAVRGALEAGAERLVLDLANLTFVDSSGLRLLITLSARAPDEGWTLALTRPPEPSMSVFRLTGAEENLPFAEEQGAEEAPPPTEEPGSR